MKFLTACMQKLADAVNKNGGIAYNDGTHYYVAGFTYGDEPLTPQLKTRSKQNSESHVVWFSTMPNVVKIIVEKYPNVVSYHRQERGKWIMRS